MVEPSKKLCLCLGLVVTAALVLAAGGSSAHLPAYEGERVRNDNHFTSEGFAWPVRGECDFGAVGPTDVNAGSANNFLGPPNAPPNFFCAFTTQDDWSFEYPIDIIESSRTPSPDPRDLSQPLEEGYIPCSGPGVTLECPRQLPNPGPGPPIQPPGMCVDLGQPDDPTASPDPDGEFHCALLPGSPRPRTSSVLMSTLTGKHDVDWAVYRYDPVYAEVPIVGAPQVPACSETIGSFVTFAYAGPLSMRDARTGKRLFMPVDRVRRLPDEVRDNLPAGYGIRVKRPSRYKPSRRSPRIGYASGYAQNAWLLAEDSLVECIDDFETCYADETGELSKHYNYNDLFFIDESTAVDLYLMWWVDGRRHPKSLRDVSITTGVIDQFIVGDFINIGITGPFTGNGRYIHGKCGDPRPTGEVEITIETN